MTKNIVLVLGEWREPSSTLTDDLAAQLEGEGFEVEWVREALPILSDPDAEDRIRQILSRFAQSVEARGGTGFVHPGVTLWGERPETVNLGTALGLTVISPSARILSLFANHLNFLTEAERAGIPHLVIDFSPLSSLRELERWVEEEVKYRKKVFPFVLKAVQAAGSLGIYVVQGKDDFRQGIPLWLDQLRQSMGQVSLLMERYLDCARHVLVPFVRFSDGRIRLFPKTDASLQSRYRKIVEICPAQTLSDPADRQISEAVCRLADSIHYVGLGCFEFLVDENQAYLVGGSARLNTGFHLWERVAGTRAVSWQLASQQARPAWDEPEIQPSRDTAAGIVLRIYAEDSRLQLPAPGHVFELSEKRRWEGKGAKTSFSAELDLRVKEGGDVTSSQYGLVGMLWAGAPTVPEAIRVASSVLREVWIAGSLQTNERFLSELMTHPWVSEGVFYAGFVDEEFLPSSAPSDSWGPWFASVAGVPLRVGSKKIDPGPLSWVSGPHRVRLADGREAVSGEIRGEDSVQTRVLAYPVEQGQWCIRIGNWVLRLKEWATLDRQSAPVLPRLLAQVQGRIHSIRFRTGDTVAPHEPILILESLGVLVPHSAPVKVRLNQIEVQPGQEVFAGSELALLERVKE